MKKKKYRIRFKNGLHARPISLLVRVLSKYNLDKITVQRGKKEIDGMSVLNFLTLSAPKGAKITFNVEGSDEDRVIEYLDRFFSLKKEEALYEEQR